MHSPTAIGVNLLPLCLLALFPWVCLLMGKGENSLNICSKYPYHLSGLLRHLTWDSHALYSTSCGSACWPLLLLAINCSKDSNGHYLLSTYSMPHTTLIMALQIFSHLILESYKESILQGKVSLLPFYGLANWGSEVNFPRSHGWEVSVCF